MSDQVASPIRTGSCVCRGVTFRVVGEPLRVGICHCVDCRKTSGAPFAVFAIWPIAAFEQKTGYVNSYAGRSFCTTCGSRVMALTDDEAEIMIGSLDEVPTDLRPQYELWTTRRENWFNALPWATQYEKDRVDAAPPELNAEGSEDQP